MLLTTVETSQATHKLQSISCTHLTNRVLQDSAETGLVAATARCGFAQFPILAVLPVALRRFRIRTADICVARPAGSRLTGELGAGKDHRTTIDNQTAKTFSKMPEQSPPDRYKADMPQIPGVPSPRAQSNPLNNPTLRLVAGLLLVLCVVFFAARWMLRPQHSEAPVAEPPPKIEVPSAAPDPSAALLHASDQNPSIASVEEMSQAWSSKQFFMRDSLTGQEVPAMLIRLPSGSATLDNGYWAFSLKAPYGGCQLEYVSDLAKLKSDYDFKRARHAMVGNPCTRTVFDPTKLFNLPGNVWVRGAMVQGSDLRPPIGIEVKVAGKTIQAVRME